MHLSLLLDMAAGTFGDRPAVGTLDTAFSARELRRRAGAGAALLRELDASALLYLDVYDPAYPVGMFAAARAGVPFVPLNYRLGAEQLAGLGVPLRR